MSGHCDDRNPAAGFSFPRPDLNRGLQPVLARHLHIHQDDVEFGFEVGRQGFVAIAGHGDRMTLPLEQPHCQELIDRVVFR